MLVLTRKRNEEIYIGDNIKIKVIRTGANTVKIGIDAPETVRILRGELCEESVAPPIQQKSKKKTEPLSGPFFHAQTGSVAMGNEPVSALAERLRIRAESLADCLPAAEPAAASEMLS